MAAPGAGFAGRIHANDNDRGCRDDNGGAGGHYGDSDDSYRDGENDGDYDCSSGYFHSGDGRDIHNLCSIFLGRDFYADVHNKYGQYENDHELSENKHHYQCVQYSGIHNQHHRQRNGQRGNM